MASTRAVNVGSALASAIQSQSAAAQQIRFLRVSRARCCRRNHGRTSIQVAKLHHCMTMCMTMQRCCHCQLGHNRCFEPRSRTLRRHSWRLKGQMTVCTSLLLPLPSLFPTAHPSAPPVPHHDTIDTAVPVVAAQYLLLSLFCLDSAHHYNSCPCSSDLKSYGHYSHGFGWQRKALCCHR